MSNGIDVKIDASGVRNLRNKFREMMHRAPKGAEKAVTKLVLEMKEEVKKQFFIAGLNEETGAYLRSITPIVVVAGNEVMGVVSTSAPQAARLELGYIGVDSLGRHYADPPHPHWRPALMMMQQKAPREVYGAVISEISVF